MSNMQEYLPKIEEELRLRNYSRQTIKSYLMCLRDYFAFLEHNPSGVAIDLVRKFLLGKQVKGYSQQTTNLYLNSIKFFYRDIQKSPEPINLKFAKRSKKLPIVLSRGIDTKIWLVHQSLFLRS